MVNFVGNALLAHDYRAIAGWLEVTSQVSKLVEQYQIEPYGAFLAASALRAGCFCYSHGG